MTQNISNFIKPLLSKPRNGGRMTVYLCILYFYLNELLYSSDDFWASRNFDAKICDDLRSPQNNRLNIFLLFSLHLHNIIL